jgi:hypothetical protein
MARLNLPDGETVAVTMESADQVTREVRGLRTTAYDVPGGCCAGLLQPPDPLVSPRRRLQDAGRKINSSACASRELICATASES